MNLFAVCKKSQCSAFNKYPLFPIFARCDLILASTVSKSSLLFFKASLKSWYNSFRRAKASSTSPSDITYLLRRDDGRFCRVASGPLHRGNLKCSDCNIFLWADLESTRIKPTRNQMIKASIVQSHIITRQNLSLTNDHHISILEKEIKASNINCQRSYINRQR